MSAPSYPNWNFQNKHLPASIYPAWTYDNNSFAWWPKAYNELPEKNYRDVAPGTLGPLPPEEIASYWGWIQQEKNVPQPVMLQRGGMTPQAAFAIQTSVFNLPDLQSTSEFTNQKFQKILRNMSPALPPILVPDINYNPLYPNNPKF